MRIIVYDTDMLELNPMHTVRDAEVDRIVGYLNADTKLRKYLRPSDSVAPRINKVGYIKRLDAWCNKSSAKVFVITLDDRAIGTISLVLPVDGRARTGYWLSSEYWGIGIGTRAFSLLLDEAKRLGAQEISGDVSVLNLASLCMWRRQGAHEQLGHDGMAQFTLNLVPAY